MPASVRIKPVKKQSVKQLMPSKSEALSPEDRDFECSLLALENACHTVLQDSRTRRKKDTQRLYWQQRFINIANPVSLALMEYKGPRHFHYHYKHREDDESVLRPVLENPVDMLALVCKDALSLCRTELVGIEDTDMVEMRFTFEGALIEFLQNYNDYRLRVSK